MLKSLALRAVTRVNRATSDGFATRPAGRLGGVVRKLCLRGSPPARGRGETGRRCRLKIGFLWSAGSSPAVRTILIAAALAGCGQRRDDSPIVASAIGAAPVLADAARGTLPFSDALLTDAVAQGLVRFDAGGQIQPGLAERWIVIDGGRTFIFRLADAHWSDGTPVTADQVVTALRRRVAATSGNPLAPYLSAIGDIVAMTPQVIEVELKRQRPDLLKLFAQPELGIVRTRRPAGTGPMRATPVGSGDLLRPALDPNRIDPDDPPAADAAANVRLIGERAARAIARFSVQRSDLVAGGSFDDWPLLATAEIAPTNIRVDPAAGLFGLAIVDRSGFLADPDGRRAIAEAIDRTALTAAIRSGWEPAEQILPEQLDSAALPASSSWTTLDSEARRSDARAAVARWAGAPITLRVALPPGPGATRLFGAVAASLLRIGVAVTRVAADAPADLRLIDAVAPYDSARWYLATACQPCSTEASTALAAARDAPTLDERSRHIADADALLAADGAFIALARPLRWSLVALRLRAWTANARAWHPLNALRSDTN